MWEALALSVGALGQIPMYLGRSLLVGAEREYVKFDRSTGVSNRSWEAVLSIVSCMYLVGTSRGS